MAKQNEKTMLEQLLEAIEQGKTMVRELHEATKDSKVLLKELREQQDKAVREQSEAMDLAATHQLEALVPSIKKVLNDTLDTHTHILEQNVIKIMFTLDQVHAKYRQTLDAAGLYAPPPSGDGVPPPRDPAKSRRSVQAERKKHA